eukprot:gene25543-11187_t
MKDTKRQREEMKQALRQAGATEQNMSRDVATAVKAQNRLLERVQIIATEDAKMLAERGEMSRALLQVRAVAVCVQAGVGALVARWPGPPRAFASVPVAQRPSPRCAGCAAAAGWHLPKVQVSPAAATREMSRVLLPAGATEQNMSRDVATAGESTKQVARESADHCN